MADARRSRIVLGLATALLAGCATTDRPGAKVEIFDPVAARSRSVAVIADNYLQDFELADKLRDAIREDSGRSGFDVKSNEDAADLVIVPTVRLRDAAPAPAPRTGTRPMMVRTRAFGPNPLTIGNGLETTGGGAGGPSTGPEAALVITATRQRDWFDPQYIDAAIPKVWRIVLSAPGNAGDETEILERLLAGAGKALDQVIRETTPESGLAHP